MNRLFCTLVFLQLAGQSMAGELRIVPLLDVDPQQTPYKALGVLPAAEESRGWAFLLTHRTRLEFLGWYDTNQNGLSHAHRIGLWRNKLVSESTGFGRLFPYLADNELVTQIEIPSRTQAELSGPWRRVPVGSIWLEPGQYHVVGEDHVGSTDAVFLWEEQNPTSEGAWLQGLSIGQTNFGPVPEGNWLPPVGPYSLTHVATLGPMLFISEIPEPTTWLLGLLTVGGTCAGWRRPCRRPRVPRDNRAQFSHRSASRARLSARMAAAWFCAVVAASSFAAAGAAQPRFVVSALAPIGDRFPGNAVGVNNVGNVAGISHCPGCLSHAYVDTTDLILPGSTFSFAYDINDLGEVVGVSANEGGAVRAFAYSPSTGITDLSQLVGSQSVAWGINNAGHIVGSGQFDGKPRAFLLIDGTPSPFPEGYSAKRINNSGLIAGYSMIIDSSGKKPMLFSDGTYADPFGINDAGQVVGQADNGNGTARAFFFDDGIITDIGTLGATFARAEGINIHGDIVGYSAIVADVNLARAFLYRDGVMHDLNSLIPPASGWNLEVASDINDRGQIVGTGLFKGRYQAFRLDPVPEPATIALFAAALAASILRRWGEPRWSHVVAERNLAEAAGSLADVR